MDSHIVDILVCPLCKSQLQKRPADGALICKADKLAFPVRDGIPILLVEQAEEIEDPLTKGTP